MTDARVDAHQSTSVSRTRGAAQLRRGLGTRGAARANMDRRSSIRLHLLAALQCAEIRHALCGRGTDGVHNRLVPGGLGMCSWLLRRLEYRLQGQAQVPGRVVGVEIELFLIRATLEIINLHEWCGITEI
jgi:hypothetical protein